MNIAVLMGGWSAEREVSLRSGAACAQALKDAGYTVTTVDVDHSISKTLSELKPDAALNVLHGPYGEDGCIQGVLEVLEIPYTHSGVLASALAMNKARSRDIFRMAGIPTAEGTTVSRTVAAAAHVMTPPYVIKPIASGSSVGVFIVPKDAKAPPQEIAAPDWSHGENVLVEKYVAGHELTCAIMGDRALDVIEITSDLEFYDYEAKYAPGGSKHILPAPIDAAVYKRVQGIALAAHQALGCRGISRADFRYDDTTGELICLEVNTQPGMTATSLVPELAAHAGLSFPQLTDWMIKDASLNR
ncbi:MAG: D-alanine--D-alanine ligase [Candidatus Kaiserbacteria bacterium]|nr:D-alanine--D-alanine ligase [Candidatus Kaiserbacteria bacterium]